MKLLVYRKKTHTDQYLNFMSHHPLHQKVGVIRTLLNRCENLVTEEVDRRQEEEHITSALKKCSYPAWSIRKAKKDMQNMGDIRIKKASQKKKSCRVQAWSQFHMAPVCTLPNTCFLGPTYPNPKVHLDRFSCFCAAHGRVSTPCLKKPDTPIMYHNSSKNRRLSIVFDLINRSSMFDTLPLKLLT